VRILLASSHGIGAWFLLRLMREGHQCDWFLLTSPPRQAERRILRGLIPAPLDAPPTDFSQYDLVIFDSTGHGEFAEEVRKQTPVIGDGELAARLEDDRLFGIQVMEQCGIEVPKYQTFESPDDARKWIEDNPKRYVYKPFTPEGQEQDCDVTYVSESAEDLIQCLDHLFEDSMHAPFLLQEVVEGEEVATEGWFDGFQFHFPNHTLEEKKFMSGGYGPNTGSAGCLMWATNGPSRLFTHSLGRMAEFLSEHQYRGMIDINTIVNQQHVWGLEFTPRFGYDSSATVFSLIKSNFGEFCHSVITQDGTMEIPLSLRAGWAGSVRYSIPPYPEEVAGRHPRDLPIKGVELDDAWLNWFLYDAMLNGEGLVTAGINGLIGCPIACGHTPEGAWKGIDEMQKKIHIPDGQARCDMKDRTLKRLQGLRDMGWVG